MYVSTDSKCEELAERSEAAAERAEHTAGRRLEDVEKVVMEAVSAVADQCLVYARSRDEWGPRLEGQGAPSAWWAALRTDAVVTLLEELDRAQVRTEALYGSSREV